MDALPPQVVQICESSRNLYVDFLTSVLASPELASAEIEAELRNADGTPFASGRLKLPARADFIGSVDGAASTMATVASAQIASFTPFSFLYAGATVEFTPFTWDRVIVDADLAAGPPTDHIVADWFHKAYVPRHLGGDQFKYAVHYASDPEKSGNGIRFETDFGTAPVDVMAELLARLAAGGATRIRISGDGLQ